jgi:RHS repeat-associated protein
LVSVTDPRNKTVAYGYDAQGNRTSVTLPSGAKTTFGYDSSGRTTSMVEARGNEAGANPDTYKWVFTYNNHDQMRTATDPLGNVTERDYDGAGNVDWVKDAKVRTTDYAYDAANHLTSVDPPGTIAATTYTYDANGNLVTRTDAKSHTTTYRYDKANRLDRVTSPIGQQWDFEYDGVGNRTKVTDANGNATSSDPNDGITTYAYDELNRLKTVTYSDATPDVTFAYDPNSNPTSMTDGQGTETYVYDDLNRLESVTRGVNAFAYEYNGVSAVTRRTYPDGTVVDYDYNDNGWLWKVTRATNTTVYDYDPAGNLKTTTLPNGNGYVETRTYDAAGRLLEVKNDKGGTVLSKATYTLDATGNPTSITTTGGTETFDYDSLDRLISVCYQANCPNASDPQVDWTYDDVGNRLTEVRPAGTTTYGYNNADQLTSSTGPGGTTNYGYDSNGNMTQSGSRTFGYDMANRMITTTSGSTTTTYAYDGIGRRIEASTGPNPADKTRFLWDVNHGLPQLAIERDGNDALLRRYVHGNDLISMTAGGGDYFYHYDGIGSVTNVTSATGTPQWSYSYEPFGTSRTASKLDPLAPDNPMRYTGQYLDPTDLYHMRARQMDPALGRFTERDPIPPKIFAPCISTYVYANNTPTSMIDPAGLEACQVNRGGDPPEAYWNIRSHMDFWDQQEQAGLNNPNGVAGFFQWAGGNIFGGALDISGLDTVQASAETLGTACTSGYDKFMSGLSIAGVGVSWYTGGTAASSRVGWSSSLFGRGGDVAKTGSTFKGFLNRGPIRIGWGYHVGRIFRIGIGSGRHIDLWR